MYRVYIFLLGSSILLSSLIDSFLSYLGFNVYFSLVTIALLLLAVFSLILRNLSIFKYQRFLIYYLLLLVSMVSTTLLTTRYDISSDYPLYYLIVVQVFVILLSFHMLVNFVNLTFFLNVNLLIYYTCSMIYVALVRNAGILSRPEGTLGISDTIAIIGIIFSVTAKHNEFKYIGLLASFLLLLFYASFTSITCFVIAVSIYFTYLTIVSKKALLKLFSILLLIIVIILSLSFYTTISYRLVQLSGNSSFVSSVNKYLARLHYVLEFQDGSLQARIMMFQKSIDVLREKPVFGEFLYEYRLFGRTGTYVHNILSFWLEYGLINFLLIFVPYFVYLVKSYRYFRRYGDKMLEALFFSGVYVTLILVLSRSYGTVVFWIHFALTISYVMKFERELKANTKIHA